MKRTPNNEDSAVGQLTRKKGFHDIKDLVQNQLPGDIIIKKGGHFSMAATIMTPCWRMRRRRIL
jgi:hypothetical protein